MAKVKEKEDEEIVMVGPGAEDDGPEDDKDQVDAPEVDDEEKERKNAKGEEEEESEPDDARAGHGEDDEEEEEGGKSNSRESSKARRERQKRARERNQREILFLRRRNETLEKQHNDLAGRVTATEATTIDQRINSLESQLKVAQNVEAEAIRLQEGEDAVEARSVQTTINKQLDRLKNARQEIASRSETRTQKPDPDVVFQAEAWIEDHDWYDPNGRDKDSRTVARLDQQLVRAGYDPKNSDYWDELTKRARKALPHRFKETPVEDDESEEERPARTNGSSKKNGGGGPRFSTGGRERPLAKNEVYISPERKSAMQEAGVWDDKVLRTRYLKNYQKWDRENKDSRNR